MHKLLQSISFKAIAFLPDYFSEKEKEMQWRGNEPATGDYIAKAEKRLGITLPTDVKEFYKITNGN